VAPFGDTLFTIFTPIGSFTASDRANAITDKIEQLYEDSVFIPDSLSISISETAPQLVYKDMVVMSVSEMEALWLGVPQDSLARAYQEKIQQAIQEERKANSSTNILLRIGAILLILLGVYVLIYLINIAFKMINTKAISSKGRLLKGIKVGGYQFLNSDQELKVVLILINGARLFSILLAFSIALPLLFSVFPWTRGIAETLIDWVFSPLKSAAESVIDYLPNLVTIFIIGTITHFTLKFFKFLAIEIERGKLKLPGFYPDWAKPTLNIVKLLIYAFSFILIWPYIPGSDSVIFQGVSVFFGVLFSLGSSSAIANGVAGLVITYMRPFKVGDRVKIGEISGDVIEKSLLVTRVRTTKNENITLPNSTILAGATINYTTSAMESGLILYTSVTIGYDAPWRQVHELLINAALATDGILKDENHKPFVLQTSLDDFYVAYQINAYTDVPHRMPRIYSELHQNIQDKFNEAGVEIMSPHYRSGRDGNMTTIPSDYLPKDYRAPMFNVNIDKPKEK
jgi:small-conductance mechanosensitive channel